MFEEFRAWLTEYGKSENTIQSYMFNIGQYMKWHQETFGVEMTNLLHGNVLDYRSYLQNMNKQMRLPCYVAAFCCFFAFYMFIMC